MSDILIKNMEMPKSCDNCWALDDYGDYPRCRITEEQRGYNFPIRDKRMDKCPLVEIKPHGRLIDANALLESIKEARKKDPDVEDVYIDDYFIMAEWLMSAPTIIPAEEGE